MNEHIIDELSNEADRLMNKYVKSPDSALVAAAMMAGVMYSAAADLFAAAWQPGNEDARKILRNLARGLLGEANLVKDMAGLE